MDIEKNWVKHGLGCYAKAKGWKLSDVSDTVIKGLLKREGNCPCRMEDVLCPCPDHEKEIEVTGTCHCHLFVKV